MITKCCKCQRIKTKLGSWVTPEEAMALGVPDDPVVSHGYCTGCAMEKWRELYEARGKEINRLKIAAGERALHV